MQRFKLPLLVFAGLAVLEVALLTFVDTTTRPLDRAGAPFRLDNIAAGTEITQRVDVGADGFNEVRLDGSITPGERPAMLRARLVEVDTSGAVVREIRAATVELAPPAAGCCVIRFQPIADSRWRAYRLDVTVGNLNGRRLSLWAVPGPVNGRLTINGRPQVAFLLFTTKAAEGTGLGRLRRAPPGKSSTLAALALLCNAAVAATVHLLITAYCPRPA